MSVAAFSFTDRARPVVQLGLGDTRIDTGAAQWNVARWSDPDYEWAGTAPYWLDITCWVHEAAWSLGRRRLTDRYDPGVATFVLDNRTGFADINPPDDDIALLQMRPGRSIRIGVVHEVHGTVWLFRGYVDECSPRYDPLLHDVVDVAAICALGEVGRVELPQLAAPIGSNELAGTRVRRFLNDANWPAAMRDVDDTGVHLVADDTGGQLADLLAIVADSCGGAVFGDTAGRLAFRGKDWQRFEAGREPDGFVGNVAAASASTPAYLDPNVGTAATPDPATMPTQFVIVAEVHGPTVGVNQQRHTIASQWISDTSWALQFDAWTGQLVLALSRDGFTDLLIASLDPPFFSDPGPHALAVAVDNSGASTVTTVWFKDGGTWDPEPSQSWTKAVPFNSTDPVVVGAIGFGNSQRFQGFIDYVEVRTGLNPTAGSVLWRFDASDAPIGEPGYVDPRGDGWLLGSIDAITPAQPATPGDVCPISFDFSARRSDIVTRVVLGRVNDTQTTWNDAKGQALMGVEVYRATDLVTRDDEVLGMLADRLFRTRGYQNSPRLDRVGFDAATSPEALDLMTTCDVFAPSLYRVRFKRDRGVLFNRLMFATGVQHRISRDRWQLDIDMDWAAGWQFEGGVWDEDLWNEATWVA